MNRRRRRSITHAAALAAMGGLALWTAPLAAQSIGLALLDSAAVQIAPGSTLTVPLRVDLSAAGGLALASLQAAITWGAGRLTFDSLRVVGSTGFSLATNTAGANTGSVAFNLFSPTALGASGTVANAYFTAGRGTGGTRVGLTLAAAGSESGQDITNALRHRTLAVCVAPSGRWGNVNDDDVVNIIDAQQLARYSVGLNVANAAAVAARGDVTGDGAANIIDAQQIARYSIALTSAARVNTPLYTPPAVASLALAPGGAQSLVVGGTVLITPTPLASDAADLTGCQSVLYSSATPAVATVSSTGEVTAVATGTTTITATSAGRTSTMSVTVVPPFTLAIGTQPAGATSNVLLRTQPVVEVRDSQGALLTADPRTITASVAAGPGVLSGTTSVITVNGRATFTDLAITGTGAHTVRFSSGPTAAVTSASLAVSAATSMRVLLGTAPTVTATVATDLAVPVLLDLSGRGTADLSSLTLTVQWDPAAFAFVAESAGSWVDADANSATVLVNTANTAAGTLQISGFTTGATVSSFALRTITLRPRAAGTTPITVTVPSAGDANGSSVAVTTRTLLVSISP